VRLWGAGGRLLGQYNQVPAGQAYPPDLWRAGDIVRDGYPIRVDERGPAVCQVMVSLNKGDEPLGEVRTPMRWKLAPPALSKDGISMPVRYVIGEQAELIGYDLPEAIAPGAREYPVTLYWHVLEEIDDEYTVFVHLADAAGQVIGQGDGVPMRGDYPTTHWSPGEAFADVHLVLSDEAVREEGHLLIGMFRPQDGVRQPVYTLQGDRAPNDAIRLDMQTQRTEQSR
jgi:hypothetical protein